jgi:D-alanyl-D-alanine carboxypeptidase
MDWINFTKNNPMKTLLTFTLFLVFSTYSSGQGNDLEKFISEYAKKHDFNGTLLIQRNEQIQYNHSFGLANRQYNISAQNDTRYKIASITKLFTSLLIMELYEQGKIDLNKTIRAYIPDYKGAGAEKVTIHQLLNHTSGIVNIDTISSVASAIKHGVPVYQRAMTTDDLLIKYCSDSLVHEPGKVFSYNNAEYIILGKIIEHITGKTYEQVLVENILKPLNMENSGLLYQYNIITGLADSYFFRDDLKKLVNDLPVYIENWYASGAMFSTAGDLLKFSDALLGLKLVSKETLEMIFRPGLDEYGYGVWSYMSEIKNKKYKTIKRPGRIMGAQGMLLYIPAEKLIIIILCNTDITDLDDFAAAISRKMLQ